MYQKENSRITEWIKPGIIVFLLFTLSCNPIKQTQRKASKSQIEILYPNVPFDSVSAKCALAYGNTSIEGVAFTKPKTQFGYKAPFASKIYAKEVAVLLFPVTPYFEEWYRLRKNKEGKMTQVYMSNEAFRFHLSTQTDTYGRFKFDKMKPGRYFLQCVVSWTETRTRDVYRGTSYGNFGTSANHYSQEKYWVNKVDRLEEFVTIKDAQKVSEVTLK